LQTYVHHQVNDVPNGTVSWPLENESSGTERLFKLAGPIIDILMRGGTFVIDELDNSLHPDICRYIVDQFHRQGSTVPAQLIFTTHDTSIMTGDLFRRDQIWFTEKSAKGNTSLYSLASFNKNEVRNTTPYDKWYLAGRFGAIPIVTE
jgi:AAA15 family ATPase/GTPase